MRCPDDPWPRVALSFQLSFNPLNSDGKAVAQDMTDIASLVRCHAERSPNSVALDFDGVEILWSEFATRVEGFARNLLATVPGNRIAITLPNGPDLVVAMFATLRAGKSFQVFDPEWPENIRASVAETLGPDLVIGTANIELLLEGECGGEAPLDVLSRADVRAPFYTGFTSGSTGTPKGFRRNQLSWLESFRRDGEIFDLSGDDVFVSLGNLAHSLFVYAVFRGLYAGGKTVFYQRFRPDRILHSIAQTSGTVVYGVPTQYDALVAAACGGTVLQSVRLILVSGAKLPDALKPPLRLLFPNALICEFYGTSEHSYITYARDGETPSGSVGKPFSGISVQIRDAAGDALPVGDVGRIFVESPLLFDGYELADNPTLERDGDALFVGDLGYLDEEGFLFLTGRSDRMFVSSGKNIYPEEIETVVAAYPSVRHACAMGIEDARRGQRPVALVQLELGRNCSSQELKAWCRERLLLHKVPAQFHQVDYWPMTASQKTDVPRLCEWLNSGSTRTLR